MRPLVETDATRRWWHADPVGYEVYLRSFADGNDDGIGDLIGLRDRLDHLAWLGVDVVWVTPFYPSPMKDYGYDVADHCDVDPRFGTLADLDAVVSRAHELGLRIIVDLVPNHTSDAHPWFVSARSGSDHPERDLYIWRDPGPDGGPPNNWVSHFGGPAWTLDDQSGQYYCHLFLPEQPDLNWSDERVRSRIRDVIRFWLDRGVDGFRIDVAHGMVKDAELRDNPIVADVGEDASPRTKFWAMAHVHDLDQDEVHDIYRDWRTLVEPAGAALLGEVYLKSPERVGRYVASGGALDMSLYVPMVHTPWDADRLRAVITEGLHHGQGRFCWVLSSHDDPRAPTRLGGGDLGRRRALALTAFLGFLPGPLFLYQGDELGLENGHVAPEDRHDPVATRNDDPTDGRDPVRTPIPWHPDEPHMGFSGARPWLPVAPNHGPETAVASQRATPMSSLHAMRDLLARRRDLLTGRNRSIVWRDLGPSVLAFERDGLVVALNAGTDGVSVPDQGTVVYRAGASPDSAGATSVPPDSCVVTDAYVKR